MASFAQGEAEATLLILQSFLPIIKKFNLTNLILLNDNLGNVCRLEKLSSSNVLRNQLYFEIDKIRSINALNINFRWHARASVMGQISDAYSKPWYYDYERLPKFLQRKLANFIGLKQVEFITQPLMLFRLTLRKCHLLPKLLTHDRFYLIIIPPKLQYYDIFEIIKFMYHLRVRWAFLCLNYKPHLLVQYLKNFYGTEYTNPIKLTINSNLISYHKSVRAPKHHLLFRCSTNLPKVRMKKLVQ